MTSSLTKRRRRLVPPKALRLAMCAITLMVAGGCGVARKADVSAASPSTNPYGKVVVPVTPTTTMVPATAECSGTEMRLAYTWPGAYQADATQSIEFQNTYSESCYVPTAPQVQVVEAGGSAGAGAGPQDVTPGASARRVDIPAGGYLFMGVGTPAVATCPPVTATSIEVYFGGQAVSVPAKLKASCSLRLLGYSATTTPVLPPGN